MTSLGRDGVRTLIVTRLDLGSEGACEGEGGRWGVLGEAGSESRFMTEEKEGSPRDPPWKPGLGETRSLSEVVLSTDLLREAPLREVRRRFREEISPSSKGLGRVEQGSDETARSLDCTGLESWSIWVTQKENR